MARYMIKTFLSAIPTILGVVTIVFFLIHLTPGDPALAILGPHATAESIEQLRKGLGLDQPLYVQYFKFLGNLLRGDLGKSIMTGQSVLIETIRPLPSTVILAFSGVAISIVLGVPIGIISAIRRNSLIDYLMRTISISGVSVPVFFMAVIFLLIFSYHLEWFPAIGVGDPSSLWSLLHHLVLPAMTIGIAMAVLIMRLTRSCMLEVLGQDYIRTARAKGLAEKAVILGHGLKNAMLPIVTVIGLTMGQLLGGAVLVETVYARQGVGKILMDAIFQRDYPQVQGTVLIFACAVIFVNLLVDLIYCLLDPRIKL